MGQLIQDKLDQYNNQKSDFILNNKKAQLCNIQKPFYFKKKYRILTSHVENFIDAIFPVLNVHSVSKTKDSKISLQTFFILLYDYYYLHHKTTSIKQLQLIFYFYYYYLNFYKINNKSLHNFKFQLKHILLNYYKIKLKQIFLLKKRKHAKSHYYIRLTNQLMKLNKLNYSFYKFTNFQHNNNSSNPSPFHISILHSDSFSLNSSINNNTELISLTNYSSFNYLFNKNQMNLKKLFYASKKYLHIEAYEKITSISQLLNLNIPFSDFQSLDYRLMYFKIELDHIDF